MASATMTRAIDAGDYDLFKKSNRAHKDAQLRYQHLIDYGHTFVANDTADKTAILGGIVQQGVYAKYPVTKIHADIVRAHKDYNLCGSWSTRDIEKTVWRWYERDKANYRKKWDDGLQAQRGIDDVYTLLATAQLATRTEYAARILQYMLQIAYQCKHRSNLRISYRSIAIGAGVSKRTCQKYLKQLQDDGVIERVETDSMTTTWSVSVSAIRKWIAQHATRHDIGSLRNMYPSSNTLMVQSKTAGDSTGLLLSFHNPGAFNPHSHKVWRVRGLNRQVWAFVHDSAGVSTRVIADMTGRKLRTVQLAVKRLARVGLLVKDDFGNYYVVASKAVFDDAAAVLGVPGMIRKQLHRYRVSRWLENQKRGVYKQECAGWLRTGIPDLERDPVRVPNPETGEVIETARHHFQLMEKGNQLGVVIGGRFVELPSVSALPLVLLSYQQCLHPSLWLQLKQSEPSMSGGGGDNVKGRETDLAVAV